MWKKIKKMFGWGGPSIEDYAPKPTIHKYTIPENVSERKLMKDVIKINQSISVLSRKKEEIETILNNLRKS